MPAALESAVSVRVQRTGSGVVVEVEGRLDAATTGRVWRETAGDVAAGVTVDASKLAYCDGSGIGWIVHLRERCSEKGAPFEVRGLAPEYQRLLDLFPPGPAQRPRQEADPGFVAQIGESAAGVLRDMRQIVSFVGELGSWLARAAVRPREVRWKDALVTAERAGLNALPIIALVGFLIGLILAFQAAIPMKQFGAEIFVADLVALSVIRELGPLMTAIILAGRSGSAFAAEIGTMRVNEEINALTTMGLPPVRFLVLPRVIATLAITPVLTVFTNLFALVGGLVVMWSLGFPTVTYLNQVRGAVGNTDLPGGLFKSLVFGLLVSAIGCLRGLQTGTGASAVGQSTTRAVVAGIILIIVSDGVFSVLFYILDI
jgi:phospholipid/cholesterol/gamma-HCH transport system permease protein